MLSTFMLYIFLVLVILFLVMVAQRLRTANQIVLVIAGLIMSLLPGLPHISINPDWIFIIFLPPLLYEAAWNTSWKEFWRFRRVISSFAFLIVIVNSFVIALVASHLLPGFTMAMGFLLGGIISPPDAVSATSILKFIRVPKSLSAILEGESLMNDASSLIVFRFALIAVDTGRFIFHEAAIDFILVIAMGIGIGLLVGLLYYAIHRFLPTTSQIDVVLTLTAPYIMYISAESFHFSGVLAVVSGGLFLSSRSHIILSYRSRYQGGNVWSTLSFVLNGLVFLLIGLELPVIVGQLGPVSLKVAIGYGILITLVLMVTRIICTLGASVFTRFISRYITTADSNPGWKGPLVFGWAGMRGVVSLAAALAIPFYLTDGTAFPQRNLILFITFMVILLTLLVQGLTLPWLIRWLRLADTDGTLPDEEQDVLVRRRLADYAVHFLQDNYGDVVNNNRQLQAMLAKLQTGTDEQPERLQDELDFMKIYLQMLEAQRVHLLQLEKENVADNHIIRKHQGLLDLEEEKIRMRFENER